jgi:hypothetical protein
VSVSEGGTLTVSAAVDGTAPLIYQWHDSSGAPQFLDPNNPSLTSATLVLTNVPVGLDGDNLTLTVTNIYGSRDSTPVVVAVISGPPQITASNLPPEVTLLTGQSYTYSVTASGTLPMSYQWRLGGSPLPGQSNAAYTYTAGALGTYVISVFITNINGTFTSADSALTVVARTTNAYAATVLAYGPVGYWPLQETSAPAPANMETNLGTLGKLGNAYYAATNASNVTFGQGGVTADSDLSVGFSGVNGVTPTSYAYVPRVTPALTFQPPLTLEAWVNSSSTGFGDLIGEGGSGLNSPAAGGNWGGIRMAYGGNATGGPNLQAYAYDGNGSEVPSFPTPPGSLPLGAWHHCVLTFDGSTGILYIDGRQAASGPLSMAPDTWSPLTIGAGRWQGSPPAPTRGLNGLEDEVAVYTNVLSALQVTNHYVAGFFGGNYPKTVLDDHPLLYWRMNNPAYLPLAPSLYPTALNYGLSSVNGSYASGIVPGGVSGPPIASLGTNGVAAPINGVFSCVDAGYDPAFNPTGTQPFTAMTWFRAYPCDGRVQTIMSHGANWSLNLDGTTGHLVWNAGVATVTSAGILNDGAWHLAAGVYDGTRNYLYVDGALDNSGTASGNVTGDTSHNLYLGGNAANILVGVNQQYFGGALAEAAFYTNALTATQIMQIYHAFFPTISIAHSGASVVLTYTGTKLLSATNVAGPYSPVAGANSPYTIPPTNVLTYYRAQK